ncbi:MAG: tRNA nucleotidyltransferase (CCA-adding enzyme), partial [Arenicella sp.]
LCERLRVPKKYRDLALAVAEYHLHMHKMYDLKASTILKMLHNTKSLNDDQRALQIAQSCLADARGRTGFEDSDYPQSDLFLEFQRAAKSVNGGEIAKGMQDGQLIQAAISAAQLEKIRSVQTTIKPKN